MKDGEKGAQQNFAQYLNEGLIKKEKSDAAQSMYIKNADLSVKNHHAKAWWHVTHATQP